MKQNGQIIQLLAGYYDVLANGRVIRTRARGNFRSKGLAPVVGDFVDFKKEDELGYITAVHERKNNLVRPPLANIDQAVVVTAVKEPDFSTNLLDRQLVALEEKNIRALIYFSKTDLLTESEYTKFNKTVQYYESMGYQVFFENKEFTQSEIDDLKKLFKNKLTIFMGQTGAGKSTLLNHIDVNLNLQTGEVSQALNRGKHTTRKVSLLPINDGLVADTPGFSTYSIFEMQIEDLKEYFMDFVKVAPNCRFRECLHLNEPGCAVKLGVEDGTILESRYQNYLQFIELIKAQKPEYKQKGYQKKDRRKKK
ncbi:ribosome small subunit-dependent GTPase A [Pediococcus claussenii]|uniref:Small ribosomal subunit biogenesis GTPase RsgA n=1 Tax=Pediococcus claussenii (strain ATCC BAA-344 / DSM 14800 / JCM 18046 / KCTC 3811 / LMG 21948 / P06) TaxID=701521 RepID=G8PDI0_PEDCP|nr:ribosome small subunit-dependent GTPase A [Pediococcus claussenii]AEV95315.1 ribosome small subunit-dependent GTPase A [Pediococcus claussenii ATCC BAA-344]ANZ68848.1 ribosome small subunit-dependent GTPase A [Pediococcus claussenii]ANZ70664.1 ribosome small subunit-dependent GTPase A [Pediococcus claussenii]KRN19503.1 rsgA protein [Pediococcus claussenii]